jgi:hypothetical protein
MHRTSTPKEKFPEDKKRFVILSGAKNPCILLLLLVLCPLYQLQICSSANGNGLSPVQFAAMVMFRQIQLQELQSMVQFYRLQTPTLENNDAKSDWYPADLVAAFRVHGLSFFWRLARIDGRRRPLDVKGGFLYRDGLLHPRFVRLRDGRCSPSEKLV